MKDYINIFIDKDLNDKDILEKLNGLLEIAGAEAHLKQIQTKDSGETYPYIRIEFDEDIIRIKKTRKAGRNKVYSNELLSLDELEKRISDSNAKTVAKELDISRATLFRKIKEAKEMGMDYVI